MDKNEILKELANFTTSELCDGAGLYHSMSHEIRHFVGKNKIIGTAVTVDVPSGEGFPDYKSIEAYTLNELNC